MPVAHAWMIRSGQQERFIRRIIRELRDKTEISPEFVRAVLADILAWQSSPGLISVQHRDAANLWNDTRAAIKKFSRAPEEEAVLINRFFSEAWKLLTREAEANLTSLELADPQKIFRAPSATSEVELKNDDDES